MNIRKATLWSLAILLILLLYLVATILFTLIFSEIATRRQVVSTRTPESTFTITPTPQPVVTIAVTPEPPTPTSSPTPRPTSAATPTPTPTPTFSPTPALPNPRVVAATTVNVRSGPGTNYPVIGAMPPNVALVVTGRNEAGSWWQVQAPEGDLGWVAGSVVEAIEVEGIAVAQAPPPPAPPTPTPIPEPTKPRYQYEPSGWYADTNYGLTRFLGTITDINGNPVDGVRIEAQCGSFRIISNPSGPVGAGYFNESNTWPAGFYDITLDRRPIPCKWLLTVVESADGETVIARLSESVEVEMTVDSSIVTANWRKNW